MRISRPRLTRCALVLAVASLACSHSDGKAVLRHSGPTRVLAAHKFQRFVEVVSTGQRLSVERNHGGQSAMGTVFLRRHQASNAAASPHMKLAGARAWLALGEQRAAAQDWTAAIACASAGLQELGQHYASPAVLDDTALKLLAAEDRLRAGHAQDAATNILRILTTRTRLYVELYVNEIAE